MQSGDQVHVVPFEDNKEHFPDNQCWCRPNLEEGNWWMHNSLDRREIGEDSYRHWGPC